MFRIKAREMGPRLFNHQKLLYTFVVVSILFLAGPEMARGGCQKPVWWQTDGNYTRFMEVVNKHLETAYNPVTNRAPDCFFWKSVAVLKRDYPSLSQQDMTDKVIGAYIRLRDLYGEYLTSSQYRAYQEANEKNYSGVGMEIMTDVNGRVICKPYPDSPAARAGIGPGDVLIGVDGQATSNKTFFEVAELLRGAKGTKVRLTVRDAGYKTKILELIRQPFEFKSITINKSDRPPIITIHVFSKQTPEELAKAIKELKTGEPIVLDLRGNTGGDLFAALDSAALFLEKDKVMLKFVTRLGATPHRVTQKPHNARSSLYLWQDKLTASAAEVFIAALVENGRAYSIGEKTHGKGVAQRVVNLSDGSAMFVSYGLLIPPGGVSYNDVGLSPSYPLENRGQKPTGREYLNKVHELMGPSALKP